jgi:hypothetical protein
MVVAKDNRGNRVVFLVATNEYLFFTTGVYFIAELTKKFQLVVFVNHNLKENEKLQRLVENYNFKCVFLPIKGKYFPLHFSLKEIFTQSLITYQPVFIFQNNFTNVENMYLFYLSDKLLKKCVNAVYLNGQQRLGDEEKLILDIREQHSIDLSEKIHIEFLQKGILFFLNLRSSLNKYLNFYFIPFLLLKNFPYSFSLNHNFHKRHGRQLFDTLIVYKQEEKSNIGDVIDYQGAVVRVIAPQSTYGGECNKILYQEALQSKKIFIAPSVLGFSSLNNEKKYLDSWLKVISILQSKFQNYKLIFKLHPRTLKNKNYNKLMDYVAKINPKIKIYPPNYSAEELVISSEIVVSDVSSVLWWSSNFNTKLSISFDFFNFPGSGDMSKVNNVLYFQVHDGFGHNDLNIRTPKFDDKCQLIPTLTDFCLTKI